MAALALALPASASASAYSSVERVYATTGTVPPCQFSADELQAALKQTPPYDREYFGDFIDAVQAALGRRAAGSCGAALEPGARVIASGPLPPAPRPPGSLTAATGAALPFPLVAGACLLAVACLLGAGGWLMSSAGSDPAWAESLRRSWREAEYRLGGGWEELRDRFSRPR